MALVALPRPFILMPEGAIQLAGQATAAGSASGITFNGASDKIAWVFQAKSTTPPDTVRFVVSSYTSSGTVDATLQTVASDGTPSGTPVTNSGTASKTVTGGGYQVTAAGLAGTASLTVGAVYAIVLTAAAGFAGNFVIPARYGSTGQMGLPYALTKDSAGGWTKLSTGESGWLLGAADSGGTVMQLGGLIGAATAFAFQTFADATNPDERGSRFVPAAPMTIGGAAYWYTGGSAPGTADAHTVKLLSSVSSGGTPTEERTYVSGGGEQYQGAPHICWFSSGYDVVAGSSYGLTLKSDSTDNASMLRIDYNANGDLAGFAGVDHHSITRNNAGTVTYDTAKVYAIFPIVTHISDGAGGGGGLLTHPGMGGGMRE